VENAAAMKFGRNVLLAAALAWTLGAAPSPLSGSYALQRGAPKTSGYLRATPVAGRPLAYDLDFWATKLGSPAPIVAYSVDMTKLLHMIVVRSDFRTFAHIHPTHGSDGHFHITYRFPGPGVYHVYADTDPTGVGQQVFRFDVDAGRTSGPPPSLGAPNDVAQAYPYTVRLDRTTLSTAKETLLRAYVTENGAQAKDLHPYLGAPAHAVFLNAADFTYVHVHPLPPGAGGPMDGMPGMETMPGGESMPGMPGMSMSATPMPDGATLPGVMHFHVAVHEPGRYKLWLQFRGGGSLHVAQFVLLAR
jgi:hypothetical protein